MTKSDLVQKLSEQVTTLTKKECEVIVDTVFLQMKDALQKGEKIEIRGFGSFVVKQRRARQGRNPKSGALVSVAAKRVPFFKVGKELRLRVDGQRSGHGPRRPSRSARPGCRQRPK